ncbi:hypothetical protein KGY63_03220, partial [Candidatus Bipolaricaulota bacterium]|nr:hypothetical protein [Candidatus Bipolaricaulota bacterium]
LPMLSLKAWNHARSASDRIFLNNNQKTVSNPAGSYAIKQKFLYSIEGFEPGKFQRRGAYV